MVDVFPYPLPDTGRCRYICCHAAESAGPEAEQASEGALSSTACTGCDIVHLKGTLFGQETKKADDTELPQLTEDEKARYKTFWGRFKSQSNLSLKLLGMNF